MMVDFNRQLGEVFNAWSFQCLGVNFFEQKQFCGYMVDSYIALYPLRCSLAASEGVGWRIDVIVVAFAIERV
jgi:hypothetical protein